MDLHGPYTDTAENAKSIPVIFGAAPVVALKDYVVLLSVRVDDLKLNDVVLILGQAEVTNDLRHNVGFGRYVIRGKNETDVIGVRLIPANMDNITPGNHHRSEDFWAVDTGASGTAYYNLVAYAVSAAGSGNLVVQQGYGKLTALKFVR